MNAKPLNEKAMEAWVSGDEANSSQEQIPSEVFAGMREPIFPAIPALANDPSNAAWMDEPSDFLLGC